MNIEFELGDLKFEWDSEKAEKNWKKHKVYFETAVKVFLDENRIEDFDELHSDFEDRYKIIGKVREILVVIYTKARRQIIMDNLRICNGVPLTEKDLECLAALEKMTDSDIDYSDIPKISHEEFLRAFARKRARLQKNNLQIAS